MTRRDFPDCVQIQQRGPSGITRGTSLFAPEGQGLGAFSINVVGTRSLLVHHSLHTVYDIRKCFAIDLPR